MVSTQDFHSCDPSSILGRTKEVERTGGRAIEIGELRFIIYSEQAVLIYTIIREKTPVS